MIRIEGTVDAGFTAVRPAFPRRIAARAGLSLDRTLAIGREGNWELDASGERVVGSGLTSIKTPHRVDIDGHTMCTWCVPDALVLPVMLGKQVRLQTPCAVTGDPIRVHLTPAGVESVDPPGAVMSFPEMPFGDLARVRRDACSQGNLFRDAEAASSWLAAFATGTVLPVATPTPCYAPSACGPRSGSSSRTADRSSGHVRNSTAERKQGIAGAPPARYRPLHLVGRPFPSPLARPLRRPGQRGRPERFQRPKNPTVHHLPIQGESKCRQQT